MYTQRSNLESFARSMRGLYSPPSIDPTLDRRRAMLSAIKQVSERELTDKQREVMQLCFFEGRSITEAANVLGKNKSTVSRHLAAAKRRIEQSLKYSFLPYWKAK
jgi:DNA-directed RNA polymerase specialized sigma24 family protein